mgnify:CR=1 FL=1
MVLVTLVIGGFLGLILGVVLYGHPPRQPVRERGRLPHP